MIGFSLGCIGTWILSDAIYSILLYLNQPGVDGKKLQSWGRDHWVRVLRGCLGIAIMVIGGSIAVR